jgi:hypothetical protein
MTRHRPPRGLPHGSPGAEPDSAGVSPVKGLPPGCRVVGRRQDHGVVAADPPPSYDQLAAVVAAQAERIDQL